MWSLMLYSTVHHVDISGTEVVGDADGFIPEPVFESMEERVFASLVEFMKGEEEPPSQEVKTLVEVRTPLICIFSQ